MQNYKKIIQKKIKKETLIENLIFFVSLQKKIY